MGAQRAHRASLGHGAQGIRRHLKDCPHTSTKHRRCKCPIHVYGTLTGERIRKALDRHPGMPPPNSSRRWTAAGEIGVVKADAPTIREAVAKYLTDCEARHLGWEAMRKYRHLAPCTPPRTSSGRGPSFGSATKQAGSRRTRRRRVKPPKVTQTPTLPFSRDEMKRIVKACDEYGGNKERIKAFVLTMRYTGLRIGDAIRLSRSHVAAGRVFVRTAKTGQPVTVPVPLEVVKALGQIESGSDRYFWTGNSGGT